MKRGVMKAVVFEEFGEPAEVLTTREVPNPEPGPGQVRVRMIASPINPSDLLVVRGRYGVLPALPATPGFEGVGIVEAIGPGLNPLGRLAHGKRVVAINNTGGNWAEYAVIPSRQARPVPAAIDDDQAAVAFVNPATAVAMIRHVLKVPRGACLLQSAANSELGKMIIRLGKHDGFRTINVVRREAARSELEALGADKVVLSEGGSLPAAVREQTGGEPVHHAIDPVGGAIGTAVFESLGPGGRMLVYGSLSEERLGVASRQMIAGGQILQGFWLGHFMRSLSIPRALVFFREVFGLIEAGVLSSTIGARFPLEKIRAAVAAAETTGRAGKVLLVPGGIGSDGT
jgi:NADPH:quinone reductase-like Zn-dependent oxidoreductase